MQFFSSAINTIKFATFNEPCYCGEVAEWSNAAVLKTVEPKGSGGSNPSLSAILNLIMEVLMMIIILTVICIVIMLILFSISKSLDSLNEQLDQIVEITKKFQNDIDSNRD